MEANANYADEEAEESAYLEWEIRQMWSGCLKKSRYPTEDCARSLAKRAKRARGVNLRVYYCMLCQGFHLTSKPRKQPGSMQPDGQ